MATDLMQSVLATLSPQQVASMGRQIGASPQQTRSAIEAALPLLIGQMARNSEQPQGAQALHRALERDHAGVDVGGLLGAVLGGAGQGGGGGGGMLEGVLGAVLGGGGTRGAPRGNDALGDGMAILGHIFGQKQPRVASGVGQVSGMNRDQSNQLLAMLAPIVMAILARAMQSRGGGTSGLGAVLGGEAASMRRPEAAGGLLGAVLDRDGDGDVDLGDLMQNGQLLGGLFGRQ